MTRSLIILLLLGSLSLHVSAATPLQNCRELFNVGQLLQAEEQCLPLAESGDGEAGFWLSNIYTLGLPGKAPDLEKALEWLNRAAEAGYGPACFNLASLYERGEVLERSAKVAFHWYERGAEVDHLPSQTKAGIAYLKGIGTESDFDKARFWLEKAAEGGDNAAQIPLAILVRSSEPQLSMYWYQKAAQQGNSFAFHELAEIYADGLLDQPRDLNKAIAYARESVRLGRLSSEFLLDQLLLQKHQESKQPAQPEPSVSPQVATKADRPKETTVAITQSATVEATPVKSEAKAEVKTETESQTEGRPDAVVTEKSAAQSSGLRDEQWLMAQPADRYALQLVQFSRLEAVDVFARRYGLQGQIDYFQARTGAGDVYVVLYRETATGPRAGKALAQKLPEALRKGIWYRSFGSIQKGYVAVDQP